MARRLIDENVVILVTEARKFFSRLVDTYFDKTNPAKGLSLAA